MTGHEFVEQHFRATGRYVMRSELERLGSEADFYLGAMTPMLAILVDAPIAVPLPLHRELWRAMLERVLDDVEEKEAEKAEIAHVLTGIEIATVEDEPRE